MISLLKDVRSKFELLSIKNKEEFCIYDPFIQFNKHQRQAFSKELFLENNKLFLRVIHVTEGYDLAKIYVNNQISDFLKKINKKELASYIYDQNFTTDFLKSLNVTAYFNFILYLLTDILNMKHSLVRAEDFATCEITEYVESEKEICLTIVSDKKNRSFKLVKPANPTKNYDYPLDYEEQFTITEQFLKNMKDFLPDCFDLPELEKTKTLKNSKGESFKVNFVFEELPYFVIMKAGNKVYKRTFGDTEEEFIKVQEYLDSYQEPFLPNVTDCWRAYSFLEKALIAVNLDKL